MNKKLLFNNFDIKIAITALSKFNVIDIKPFIDEDEELHYIVIFQKGDFILCENVFFSLDSPSFPKNYLNDFIANCKRLLEKWIERLDRYFFNPVEKPLDILSHLSFEVYWSFKANYRYFCRAGLIENKLKDMEFNLISDAIRLSLINGESSLNVLKNYFKKYGIDRASIENTIKKKEEE